MISGNMISGYVEERRFSAAIIEIGKGTALAVAEKKKLEIAALAAEGDSKWKP
jgi:hypothetical protein